MKNLFRKETGTFSIEATLTFPLIVLLTFSVVFACLFFYQKVTVYHTASVAVQRAAFVWDNSAKDPVTGQFDVQHNDGLYWRLFQDDALDIFKLMFGVKKAEVTLPASSNAGSTGVAAKKLLTVSGGMAPSVTGQLIYTNRLLLRTVEAHLSQPFRAPAQVQGWLHLHRVTAEEAAYVVEPVELIRTVDLIRTFIQEVKGLISPKAAAELLQEPGKLEQQAPVFSSHEQAAAYLRKLVTGTEQKIIIAAAPERVRLVDALDANGIAHQAYYSFTEKQLLEEQLVKDVDMLKQGKVQGVVWHFFKQKSKDKVLISDSLRSELLKKGISVVIHE
ncbi:TadE/TadG family type IV pilus assembly protein [Paenibacillus thalictri]|nr:TadE family protein [Paenibacillus thalictri]